MSTIPFPNVVPSTNTRTEIANTAVFRSPFTGAIKTQGRGGDASQILLNMLNRSGLDRRRLDGFLASMRGQVGRAAVRDHRYEAPAGSISVTELIADPEFSNIAANWQTAADMVIRSSTTGLRYEQTAATVNDVIENPGGITVVSGLSYAFVVELAGGYIPGGTSQQTVKIGTTSGANDLDSTQSDAGSATGRIIASGTAAGTTLFPSFSPLASNVGQYVDVVRASFSRCLTVNGAGQTGTRLLVSDLDADTAGQLVGGDQFEIDGHLKFVTNDVDGDSSGDGVIDFFPAITTAPADNAPIILLKPAGTFMLANPNTARRNKPGGFSDYTLDFIEDPNA